MNDPSSSSNPNIYKTENIRFEWEVDFDAHIIKGSACLSMKKCGKAEFESVILDVNGLRIKAVKVSGASTNWTVEPNEYACLGSKLEVQVSKVSENFELEVEYETAPDSSALQWLEAEMTADKRRPFVFSQCQAIHARSLFPCQDTPSVKATFQATVHAPRGVTVVMGANRCGDPVSSARGDDWSVYRFDQPVPIPSYLVTIACGELASRALGPRSSVWAEPSVVDRAARVLCDTEKMLAAAEHLCGPYRWKIYDVLILPPSFPYGGMENPCLTFVSPTILAEDRSGVNVIAHEIAHSWTGNLVTNCSWEHFWLNEGHTVYLERLIMEHVMGSSTRQLLLAKGYDSLCKEVQDLGPDSPFTKLVLDLKGVDPDMGYNRIPYDKGSLLLYHLETIVGKPAMLSWLRAYLDRYAGQALDTAEWHRFMCEQLGAQLKGKVDWDAWFHGCGLPPWVPKFDDAEMLRQCDQLLDCFLSKHPENAATTELMLQLWTKETNGFQRELVIKRLVDRAPVKHENLRHMDAKLSLSSCDNAELRFGWSLVCILSRYEPALDSCLEFLNSQGRMKYTRPLYRALHGWKEMGDRVRKNFESQRPFMHRTTAMFVAIDIEYS